METEDTLKQSHKGFWEHEILQLIRNITDGDFDFKMVCNEVDKMVDFHGQLFIVRKYDDKELASLREQLKQKEAVIRELIPLAQRAKSGMWANDPYVEHVDEIIEKAKLLSLTAITRIQGGE